MAMVKSTRRLDDQNYNSVGIAAVCTGAAEKSAHCCEGLYKAKCSSKTQIELKRKVLGKYDICIMTAFEVLSFTCVRTTMAAACSVAAALYCRGLEQLE